MHAIKLVLYDIILLFVAKYVAREYRYWCDERKIIFPSSKSSVDPIGSIHGKSAL